MGNTLEAICRLEKTVEKILFNYNFLQKENEILLQDNNRLQHQILEKEEQLEEQKKAYNLLKVAKTIDGSSDNTRDTKLKINSLIKEIDKCIVQLKK